MSSYELYHFGTKGMKWGLRRYQNPDGTYTEEGKRRRQRLSEDSGFRAVLNTESKAYKNQIDDTLSIGKEGLSSAREVHGILNRRRQKKLDALKAEKEKQIDEEMSQMDDKQLQQAVNRLNMERNYKTLKTADIKLGRTLVDDVLDDVGSAVTIAGSAATVALAIYKIRGNSW